MLRLIQEILSFITSQVLGYNAAGTTSTRQGVIVNGNRLQSITVF